MRYLLIAGAMFLCTFSTSANALERLKVYDVRNFVSNLNSAVNSVDLRGGRSALENLISNQASFEDNINTQYYNNRYLVNNSYNNHYYGYRYPYYHSYAQVGYQAENKWEMISKLETKKRTIPGYHGMFEVSEMIISPLADSAVVDVSFKERSLTYAPDVAYNGVPYYNQHVSLDTHSKCKMHLAKMDSLVYLTRMYCNTSTNLPM